MQEITIKIIIVFIIRNLSRKKTLESKIKKGIILSMKINTKKVNALMIIVLILWISKINIKLKILYLNIIKIFDKEINTFFRNN